MKPRYIMLLDSNHKAIGYVSSADITVEEERSGRLGLLGEVIIRAKQAVLRMVKGETTKEPQGEGPKAGPEDRVEVDRWADGGATIFATHEGTTREIHLSSDGLRKLLLALGPADAVVREKVAVVMERLLTGGQPNDVEVRWLVNTVLACGEASSPCRPSERIYRIRRKSDGKWHGQRPTQFSPPDAIWHPVRGRYYSQPALMQILGCWRLDPEPGVMSLRDIELVVCEPLQVRVVDGEEIGKQGLRNILGEP